MKVAPKLSLRPFLHQALQLKTTSYQEKWHSKYITPVLLCFQSSIRVENNSESFLLTFKLIIF